MNIASFYIKLHIWREDNQKVNKLTTNFPFKIINTVEVFEGDITDSGQNSD